MAVKHEGILLLDKPEGKTSFFLVHLLRKWTKVQKIGHTGTLDPMATGLMVLLVGKNFTRKALDLTGLDKEYLATIYLGITSDTLDKEGVLQTKSTQEPPLSEVMQAIEHFQGEIWQVPPMFSAKKKGGKKLYELARKGIEIEREPVKVYLETTFISYEYPYLHIHVRCSKGTYIRQLAADMGEKLGTGAHLFALRRIKVGDFCIEDALDIASLEKTIENPPYRS